MKTPFFLILFFAIPALLHGQSYDLLIRNVTLVDGTGGPMINHACVYVKDGRLSRITTQALENVDVTQTVDGTGKYLIPGLIESHAHPNNVDTHPEQRKHYPHSFKTMIHYGITSVVLFSGSNGSYDTLEELQQAEKTGTMISPHIYYSSPFFTREGAHPMKTYASPKWVNGKTYYDISDTTIISKAVREAALHQAIGIKLIVEDGPTPPFVQRLPLTTIRKVVTEAHQQRLPVFAHVSDREEALLCLEAGVGNIVHFAGVQLNWAKDEPLIRRFAETGGSWITTLMLGKSLVFYRLHPEWLQRPEIKNVYDSAEIAGLIQPGMEAQGKAVLKAWTGKDTMSLKTFVTPFVHDLIRLQKEGVNVVAGTDVGGDDFILPGISLHEEFELLQMGGMEPLQIIKMATHNGAKMLGILKDYGTLEQGKYADMVLLDKNPLENISNTTSIDKVFKAGKLQPRIR